MARHGVTYQDVALAIREIEGQGKSITIEHIRAHLGTGSTGTVNKYLKQWRETQAESHSIASKEQLPDALVSLVKGLWEGVLAQAIIRFEPIETNYQAELAQLKADVQKYQTNNQRWQKLFAEWQAEQKKLIDKKTTLDQALEFAHKENQSLSSKQDVLTQQLQDKQTRIDELHQLHKQTQENLEHYRESAREQRLLDQQQFESQKQQLQIELKTVSNHNKLQRDEMALLQRKFKEMEFAALALKKTSDQMQEKLHRTEFLKTELNEKLLNAEKAIVKIEAENGLLKSQLGDAQKAFADAMVKIDVLHQEKIRLIEVNTTFKKTHKNGK